MSRTHSHDGTRLLQLLQRALQLTVQPQRRVDLPEICDKLGLPDSADAPELTKAQYVASRYPSAPEIVRSSARKFVDMFPLSEGYSISYEIEECLWSAESDIRIPLKARHEIARALAECRLFADFGRFLQGLERLFPLKSSVEDFLAILTPGRSENPIVQHMLRNNDWGAWDLFEHLNVFEVSDRRFVRLIEFLASPEIHASDERQSRVVQVVAPCLQRIGLDLAEEVQESGYPTYTIVSPNRGVRGRPKNIIFASREKPDIRIYDGINNDIELASGADEVLIFDRPLPSDGLKWQDLLSWWAETHGLDPTLRSTKRQLYTRLRSCLPENSPPQRTLFKAYYTIFNETIDSCPALLPEVWLLYDPKTIKERGKNALLNQRMDFVLLLPRRVRIVIEVDGKWHYSNKDGSASHIEYAKLMRADRELRLRGYDVFRFGGSDLMGDNAEELVRDFFVRLFIHHGIR